MKLKELKFLIRQIVRKEIIKLVRDKNLMLSFPIENNNKMNGDYILMNDDKNNPFLEEKNNKIENEKTYKNNDDFYKDETYLQNEVNSEFKDEKISLVENKIDENFDEINKKMDEIKGKLEGLSSKEKQELMREEIKKKDFFGL
jgi:hypothetical protein